MHVLVTGGLGHIGSQLIRDLAAANTVRQVTVYDDLSTQRYGALFNLPPAVAYRFVDGNILDAACLASALAGVDAVVHLAAITNAEGSFEISGQVQRVNHEGTACVVAACVAQGVRQLIFPSTTSVYGPVQGVAREDCPPADLQPQSPYAAAKLAAEHAVLAADGTGVLRTVCLRFGTIFGPSAGMRFHTAVNKFVFQAATGQPLTVWREVEQLVRPYLALQDAVRAILFMLARPAAGGEIYNVVTLNAPLARILDAIRSHVPGLQIEYTNTRLLNQVSFTVDDSKLRALGFVPDGNLEQGVADTLQLLRGLLAAGPVAP